MDQPRTPQVNVGSNRPSSSTSETSVRLSQPAQPDVAPRGVGEGSGAQGASKNTNDEPNPQCGYNSRDSDTDTTPAWATISDAMSRYDEQTVADWKEDLANLLVFTGLFSGIVTGFTIESYAWLQQQSDPDVSVQVQLLAQISAQLASFSVSSGFVNSTTQPVPLITVSSSSGPTTTQIRINILWFLSLGIGLIASLLAIMVQSWLKEFRLPGHLATRERIMLRQYRYQGLLDWGVPQIVSILPVLVQVALVLFLAGLCYLLFSLNTAVAKAFIAFVGVALSAYFAFTVLPILSRRCPYKNPIAHGISTTSRLLFSVLWSCMYLSVEVFFALVVLRITPAKFKESVASLHTKFNRFMSRGYAFLSSTHFNLGSSKYWATRELQALPDIEHLERDALVWAPSAVSKGDLPQLDQCLDDLTPEEQTKTVMSWVAQALNVAASAMSNSVSDLTSIFDLTTLNKIDRSFARRFQGSLMQVLPTKFTAQSFWESFTKEYYGPTVVVVLRHIARVVGRDTDFTVRYTRGIMTIRGNQSDNDISQFEPYSRLPTACLFECSTNNHYDFTDEETTQLFDYALQTQSVLTPICPDTVFFVSSLELILVSAATALHAVSRRPTLLPNQPDLRDKCRKMLVTLDGIIVAEKVRIRDLGSYAGNWTSDGVLLSVVPACAVMCQSVINLVEAGSLPLPTREDDDHLRLQSIVEHMIDTFEGEPAFAEGVTALVQFRGTHFVINTAGGFDLQSGNAVPSTGGSGGGFESDKGDAGDEAKDENGHDVASLMSDNINALILPEILYPPTPPTHEAATLDPNSDHNNSTTCNVYDV